MEYLNFEIDELMDFLKLFDHPLKEEFQTLLSNSPHLKNENSINIEYELKSLIDNEKNLRNPDKKEQIQRSIIHLILKLSLDFLNKSPVTKKTQENITGKYNITDTSEYFLLHGINLGKENDQISLTGQVFLNTATPFEQMSDFKNNLTAWSFFLPHLNCNFSLLPILKEPNSVNIAFSCVVRKNISVINAENILLSIKKENEILPKKKINLF